MIIICMSCRLEKDDANRTLAGRNVCLQCFELFLKLKKENPKESKMLLKALFKQAGCAESALWRDRLRQKGLLPPQQ